jgi:WD40 repeat protein
VVGDVRWLAAKIAATSVSALLSEVALLVERAPSARSRRIERALRHESGWLHSFPEALPGLLYTRLRAEGSTPEQLAELLPGLAPPTRLAHPVNLGEGRVFRGHSEAVMACAYSLDGTRVLSASADKTLREWDRSSGQELRRFKGHSQGVTACAYSPDGRRVLSASADNTVRIWAVESGRCLDVVYGVASFGGLAVGRGQFAAGDALGNVWFVDCDWL